MFIKTNVDSPLEEDIVFEETDQSSHIEDVLKNAENILKAFLYMKKMLNESSPFVNSLTALKTIDTTSEKTIYMQNENTGKIVFKNISSTDNCSIFINDGEFVLFPYESVELPISQSDKIETNGTLSIIETEYKLGKGD